MLPSFVPADKSSAQRANSLLSLPSSQKFDWHVDGPFRRGNGDMSLLTFMIYLNDGYRGGATAFHNATEVIGERGMALLFEHELMRQGAEVMHGAKTPCVSNTPCVRM